MSIYTTNAANQARNRFNLEFGKDYPDVQFQRIGTVLVERGSYTDTELMNGSVNDNLLEIYYGAVVTDGNTYTKQGNALYIKNETTESSGTITDSSLAAYIENRSDTGDAVNIANYDAVLGSPSDRSICPQAGRLADGSARGVGGTIGSYLVRLVKATIFSAKRVLGRRDELFARP